MTRDEDGLLREVEPLCDDKSRRESMMYIELDRADARGRQELAEELQAVLADVRSAVRDWREAAGEDARGRRRRPPIPKARRCSNGSPTGR